MSPVKKQSVARVLLLALFVSLPVAGTILSFLEVFEDGIDDADGLAGAQAVSVSSDGVHVYVAGFDDDAIAIFRVNSNGQLVFRGFVSDDGSAIFLDGPTALAVSPEGDRLFATTSIDDSLVVFSRDAGTDTLVQTHVFQDGVGSVDGINGAADVEVSPDGNHIYVAGGVDLALAVFSRDASTDTLSFAGREANGIGGVSGLAGASAVTVSPDGELVLVAGTAEDSVAVFSRAATTDDLTFVEALSDGVDGVTDLRGPVDVAFSSDSQDVYVAAGLDDRVSLFHRTGNDLDFVTSYPTPEGASSVAVSNNGEFVIVSAEVADALAIFARDPVDGTLTLEQTVEIGVDGVSGLEGVSGLAFRPDDSEVYTAAMVANAVARFRNSTIFLFDDGFETEDTSRWNVTIP